MATPVGPSCSRLLAVGLVLASCLPWARADFYQTYCSSQNTGSDFAALSDTWQSNGWCHDACKSQFSVAIVQANQCWCSNSVPANVVSLDNCQVDCPGYPTEKCGNIGQGLYGYILIAGGDPSTVDGSNPTSPTTRSTLRTTSSTVETPPSSVPDSSSMPATSSGTRNQASSTTPAPVSTIFETITSGGGVGTVRTILVTPTSVPDSGSNSKPSTSSGGGVSTGKVVGIVLGVALGLGLVIGLGVWFWFRRRNQQVYTSGSISPKSSRSNNGIPSRQVSQMSSAGLLGKSPRILTTGLPPGNGPRSAESTTFDRRSLGTDQRLNPYAIYSQEESRHSNVSLQDNQDYSRQLRIANPDP